MGLFRKKPVNDIRVLSIGDIMVTGGKAYRVDYTGLVQLPIKRIGAK